MDSTALLNEILGSMSVVESDFTSEWMDAFGQASGKSEATPGASEDEQQEPAFFLPSQLLDQSPGQLQSSLTGWNLIVSAYLHLHQSQVQFLVVVEVDLQIFHVNISHFYSLLTMSSRMYCRKFCFCLFVAALDKGSKMLATTTRQLALKTDVLLSQGN